MPATHDLRPAMNISDFPKTRPIAGRFFVTALMLAWLPSTLLALINPKVQPRTLFDQYNMVAGLEVVSVDSKNLTIHTKVIEVVKGEFTGTNITITGADKERLEEVLSVSPGQIIVAFAGRDRPRSKANDVLYYVGGGKWNTAQMTETPGQWTLTGNADEGKEGQDIFFGVFNGAVEQLWAMAKDLGSDRAYYPAIPFSRFTAQSIAKLGGAVEGVAIHDLNGDGANDLLATSRSGNRLFLNEKGSFRDATEESGLSGTKSRSVDVAVVEEDGSLGLLLDGVLYERDGAAWKTTTRMPLQNKVLSAAFVELNGDGLADIVVSREGAGLAAFLNPGKAGEPFTEATSELGLDREEAVKGGTGYFEAGDWNGDGRTDLVYLSGPGWLLIRQTGEGNAGVFEPTPLAGDDQEPEFGGAALAPIVEPNTSALFVAQADGKMLIDHKEGSSRDILRFGNEIQDDIPGLFMPLAEDLNADGTLDLYVTNRSEGSPHFFVVNRGYGSFMMEDKYSAGKVVPAEVFNAPAHGVAAGDVNSDGAVDLLIGGADGALTLLINKVLEDRPQEAVASTLADARKQIATRLCTVSLPAQKGVTNANLHLVDERGEVVAARRIGGNIGNGSTGPAALYLATREPGSYTLKVSFDDGHTVERKVDLGSSAPQHQTIQIAR